MSIFTVISSSALWLLVNIVGSLSASLTKSEANCMPVHKPVRVSRERMWRPRCDTRSEIELQKMFDHPAGVSTGSSIVGVGSYSSVEALHSPSKVCQFGSRYEIVIQVLYHDTGEFDIL
jgi:hypothetical protein